jgi:hypothetical protein
MRARAIQRVLARAQDRAAIGSLADLRQAYQDELAAHPVEITAEVDRVCGIDRTIYRRLLASHLTCIVCGGAMEPLRRSRLYCSGRCRTRAYRART